MGILLNHAVESFGLMSWYSNPSEYWPSFEERMANIFSGDASFFIRLVQFLGWLGDMGPGVFIFLSGLTLTLSAFSKPFNQIEFYKTRALRIYPLYIAIHLFTIAIAVFFFHWEISKFWTPFSLIGLRFTNNLFWFVNPSWWFVWLIIQLYIVFPYLFSFLKKRGTIVFLLITLGITLLSRTAGIFGFSFTADIDKWMTGIFAGTRLFEFTFGMVIGFLIYNKNNQITELLNNRIKLPVLSVLIYILGFVSSWTYIGSIFSLILITIGLSGIFYSCYEFGIKGNKKIENLILWIGKNSFSTFLIHQTFIKYYTVVLTGYSRVIVLGLIIIASFIAGHFIEKTVIKLFPSMQHFYYKIVSFLKQKVGLILGIISVVSSSILSIFLLVGKVGNSGIVLFLFLLQFLYLAFYRLLVNRSKTSFVFRYFDLAIVFSLVVLLFGGTWFSLFGLLIFLSFLLLLITKRLSHWSSLILTISVMSLSAVVCEYYLRFYKPIEISSWGELPALKQDDETVYALIPDKLTHLKYNNYDYHVQTNSLGFATPDYLMSCVLW